MSGMWSKLIKTLSLKSSAAPASSSSQLPPRVPNQPDSRSSPPRSSSSTVPSTSSFSGRLSRSFTSAGRPSKKTCAICLGNVRNGQGQAIFTAECSHSFHFSCIASSVKHGHYQCPICRCKWKEVPFQMPGGTTPCPTALDDNRIVRPQPSPPIEPLHFSDDEHLLVFPSDTTSAPSNNNNNASVKAVPEFPAVAASSSVSEFAVLVGVRASTLLDDARQLQRAPIDLVAVLDVSGSMSGSKLSLLKRAVHFVIDNLGSADRLSVVSFSGRAHRVFPLRRMTDTGREDAKWAVDSLSSDGETNIVEGLKKGARVLEERCMRNPVASIILLSDGLDNRIILLSDGLDNRNCSIRSAEYLNLLPVSIFINNRELENEGSSRAHFPVHTFGFGSDHDSFALHAISDASGGTFSFIETVDLVQDALARCIGGLLSVVAHELKLILASTSPGVEIGSIRSGRYASEISENRLRGVITIGDLYADEEKEFIVYLSVPVFRPVPEGLEKTSLLKITCSYWDNTKAEVNLDGEGVEIRRPEILSREDANVNLEVDRQKVRFSVVDAIKEAKEMADLGFLEGAQDLLTNANAMLMSSASALAGDALCSQLEAELAEIRRRMVSMEMYEHMGRAYLLSGLSSHSSQRSTTRGGSESLSNSGPIELTGYDTPTMVTMVSRSQTLSAEYYREQVRLTRSTSWTRT